jgi:hypothetical protein
VDGENASLQEMVVSYLRERGFYSLSNLQITRQEPYEIALFGPPLQYEPPKRYKEELRRIAQAYQTKIDARMKGYPRPNERQRFQAFLPNDVNLRRAMESGFPLQVLDAFILVDTGYKEAPSWDANDLQVFEDAENERLYVWQISFDAVVMWRVEKLSGSYVVTEVFNKTFSKN